ncbi:uncharacterized protein LOC134722819 [Mytilus trossulus]|uniref:uncharacterized protein LOC134722819 n=1 Tax=Mytilus trossulus TaxID=6551 RepID=UPI003003AD76
MEFFHILFLFSFDFLSVMQASGKPDPPTDVQIHVNGSTARVSWIIPTNQGITWSRIYLQDSKNKTWDLNLSPKIKYIDIMSTTNSFEIENLKMCSEYIVKIKCIIKGDPKYSDFTRQHFWMTNKTFIADINQNVTLSWTTSLTEFFNVQSAFNSTIIYGVQGGGYIISNSESGKYIFDDTQTHVKDIKVTVIHVNKIDAGLYSAETTNGNVDGCCLLIVTTKPIKPVLTIQPEHPFVGDNITFTCSSTIQRWPTGYGTSHLSYQFIGNKRGATDNNELQINKLTLSDKGTSIKCQATDNLMQVSNMSTTVTLDPFLFICSGSHQSKFNNTKHPDFQASTGVLATRLTVNQQRHRPSGSNTINSTNFPASDAHFDYTCLFSDAIIQ